MSETVSQAVARVQRPAQVIRQSLAEFAVLLPKSVSADLFEAWALGALKTALANPDTAKAWETVLHPDNEAGLISIVLALKDCASLGLKPGKTYHLVPFGGTVTGVTDWKGEVQLITNAAPCTVTAALVRQGDKFAMRAANAPPFHEPPDPDEAASWFDTSRPVVGGYAYVDYGTRCSMVERMSEAEFLKRRDIAKTKKIWDAWPDEMRLKSVVRPLRKTVPWSPERQWT